MEVFNPELHIILENSQARLEPLSGKHFKQLLPLALDAETWEFTSSFAGTEATFLAYFNNAIREKELNLQWPFAVFDKRNQRYAGSTRYGSFAAEHKRVEIGWTWYDRQARGSGLNKACKYLLLRYGFMQLGLNRIELKTSLLNLRSQQAMLKAGAIKEGVLRNHMINADGSIRDTVYFSFIKEDWEGIEVNVYPEFAYPGK